MMVKRENKKRQERKKLRLGIQIPEVMQSQEIISNEVFQHNKSIWSETNKCQKREMQT